MSNKSGYQSAFSSVNVWGSGPVLSTLRITGKSILNILEVIGDTLFKGFVYFSNDVHFENLPTSSVYSPTQINQLATKQYVDSVFVGEGIDIFDKNNTWSGTNTWEDTCTFDMGQFKFFSIGTEENVVAGINTFSTETRFSANAMNINGEEYVYVTGAGDVTIKGGGFGAPNPEGGGLIGGTLNITSALTTLESSTAITIEATNITITGAVESASITEEIALAVEVEEDRAVAAELVLEEEIGFLQGEVDALQGEIAGIAVGGVGAIATLETEILALQNRVANTTGGGRVDTSEIHFYQTNGSGNRGTISMVERNGETKIRMHDPVDFDKSIYIDEGHYISSHGDVDIRDGQKAFKGNYLRAFYHTEHPLHIGTDSSGGDGEVWIEGTINLFTKSIPRMKPTLSLVPTMNNELSTKFYVDTSITNAITVVAGSAVTLSGDQILLGGVKTFTNLPECVAVPTQNTQFVNKTYVDSSISTAGTSFVTLATTQNNISGGKTFSGNCIFWPTSGSTIIRGSEASIFADTTYIGLVKAPTAAETFCYLQAYKVIVDSNVYSFYIDAEISNFVGDQTLLQSPYTAVSSLCDSFSIEADSTVIKSPYVAITNACTSLNLDATNTFITGNVTAVTPLTSDNSTKLATTAFVNSFGNANYITLGTTQTVSGAKTFTSKQSLSAGADIGGAGITSNFTGNVNVPTQTVGDNSTLAASTAFVNSYGNANYMTIGTNQSITGVKTYSVKQTFSAGADIGGVGVTSNFTGTITVPDQIAGTNSTVAANTKFVNSAVSASLNNYVTVATDQTITGAKNFTAPFSAQCLDISSNVINTVAVGPVSGNFTSGTNYILVASNVRTGINGQLSIDLFSVLFECYYNNWILLLSLGVYVTYKITTTGGSLINESSNLRYGIPSSDQVMDAGETRVYPSGLNTYNGNCNYTFPTTANSTYNIYCFFNFFTQSSTPGFYIPPTLVGTATVRYRWTPTLVSTTSNFNFVVNPKSSFIKNTFCGVWFINGNQAQSTRIPIFYSCPNNNNVFNQPYQYNSFIDPESYQYWTPQLGDGSDPTNKGYWSTLQVSNDDNNYEVYPNYGIVVYRDTNFEGPIYLNFKNTTSSPVWVQPNPINQGSSWKLFYMDTEILQNV